MKFLIGNSKDGYQEITDLESIILCTKESDTVEDPEEPDIPDVPDVPDVPEDPEDPNTPSDPEEPDIPETPQDPAEPTEPDEPIVVDGLGAKDLVEAMGTGWNLGNTLDSWFEDYGSKTPIQAETYWGCPETTKAMLQMVWDKGFRSIRIPVTWSCSCNRSTWTIRTDFLARVKQVVDWCMEIGFIVVLNSHHDRYVTWCNLPDVEQVKANLRVLWTQIANYFKDYSNQLVFEGYNEVLADNTGNDWSAESSDYTCVNQIAQEFVNIIRSTGGNNPTRCLSVSTFGALWDEKTINSFAIPTDTVQDRIIFQVHCYDTGITDESEDTFTLLENKGVPSIIGEWGTTTEDLPLANRILHAGNFVSRCKNHGIACFWWDNNAFDYGETYGLLDRNNLVWKFEDIANAIISGLTTDPNSYEIVSKTVYDSSNLTVNNFEDGAWDSITGEEIGRYTWYNTSGQSSPIRLINKINVSPDNMYQVRIDSTESGFRLAVWGYWDKNNNFIGGVDDGWSLEKYMYPPENAAYLGISFNNPWNSYNVSGLLNQMIQYNTTIQIIEMKRSQEFIGVVDEFDHLPTTEVNELLAENRTTGMYFDMGGIKTSSNSEFSCWFADITALKDRWLNAWCMNTNGYGSCYLGLFDSNGNILEVIDAVDGVCSVENIRSDCKNVGVFTYWYSTAGSHVYLECELGTVLTGVSNINKVLNNYASLGSAISTAKDLVNNTSIGTSADNFLISQYWTTQSNMDALTTELQIAQLVYDSATSSQSAIDAETSSLTSKTNTFIANRYVGSKIDSSTLSNAITVCEEAYGNTTTSNTGETILKCNYWNTSTNMNALQSAIKSAKSIMNSSSNQSELDAALVSLTDSYNTFINTRQKGAIDTITVSDQIYPSTLGYVGSTSVYLGADIPKGTSLTVSFKYAYDIVAINSSSEAAVRITLGHPFDYLSVLSYTTNGSTSEHVTQDEVSYSRKLVTTKDCDQTNYTGILLSVTYGKTVNSSFYIKDIIVTIN